MYLHTLQWRAQRLRYLFQRIRGSMAQRGLRGTLTRVVREFQPRPSQDDSLALAPLDVPFTPFAVPASVSPEVTVVIPVYGKLAWTLACLRSIAAHPPATPVEVMVVDDASSDGSPEILACVQGLRLLVNPENIGFIGSCNRAAADAKGPFLLFLNNDTQVTPGWLDTLLETYREEPACGITGSRLIYPDGRLQEAGGLVYSDAKAWNVGRFDRRDDPRYLYRRDVDYVSGASLLISKALFDEVGGFDARYAPAYCEDMDLAFAVRALGRRVIYEPRSMVVHHEGISSGINPFAGVKQHQRINLETFRVKWADALKHQPRPDTPVEQAIQREARHILVIDALAPDPTRDAGSVQVINIMRLLRSMGWRVTFMADNRQATSEEITLLGRHGVEMLCKPQSPSLSNWLKREGAGLDAAMLCRYYVADTNLPLFRRLAPNAKVLFDTEDLHFVREERTARHMGSVALSRQAEASRRRELNLVRRADATLVVSPVEQKLLLEAVPDAKVLLLPNMHDVPGSRRSFAERNGLVFVGGCGHPPNEDAIRWLIGEIWPLLHAKRPELVLHLVGDMSERLRREFGSEGVVVHGRVPDLEPWMQGSRVALAPLRIGAGVKGKVNTAMSHGLPVVASSVAAEGMGLQHGVNALLADEPSKFANEVIKLNDDQALWERLSAASAEHVRTHFSLAVAQAALESALD
jgi:GT2 family glycosyltransferase